MPRFSVRIEGRHYLLHDDTQADLKPVGFYTVRYVKADDETAAGEYVLKFLKQELAEKVVTTGQSQLRIARVQPVESMEGVAMFEGGISGTGLMIYPETQQPAGTVSGQLRRIVQRIKHFFSSLN